MKNNLVKLTPRSCHLGHRCGELCWSPPFPSSVFNPQSSNLAKDKNPQCQAILLNKCRSFRRQNSKYVKNHLTKNIYKVPCQNYGIKKKEYPYFQSISKHSALTVFNPVAHLAAWLLTQSTNLDVSDLFAPPDVQSWFGSASFSWGFDNSSFLQAVGWTSQFGLVELCTTGREGPAADDMAFPLLPWGIKHSWLYKV